jgi:hypothetical protein
MGCEKIRKIDEQKKAAGSNFFHILLQREVKTSKVTVLLILHLIVQVEGVC